MPATALTIALNFIWPPGPRCVFTFARWPRAGRVRLACHLDDIGARRSPADNTNVRGRGRSLGWFPPEARSRSAHRSWQVVFISQFPFLGSRIWAHSVSNSEISDHVLLAEKPRPTV